MRRTRSRSEPGGRHAWRTPAIVIGFMVLFLTYALFVLTGQPETNGAAVGPLAVRTDLMRDRPCHVANATIMGDCSEEEIAALQREHESMVGR